MKGISASIKFVTLCCLGLVVFVGASPKQVERPPQPFFQDFISGTVMIQGTPAPAGTQLIACIGDCDTGFRTKTKTISEGGGFELLEVNPSDEKLIGHEISFHLVNEYGEIRALETREFVGVFDFYPLDLTFDVPLPTLPPTPTPPVPPTLTPSPQPTSTLQPTPTAILPATGDPTVAALPKFGLLVGAGVAVVGAVLLLALRSAKEH